MGNQFTGGRPKNHLHRRAEELLGDRSENLDGLLKTDIQSLIYELRVHQVELEVQNEELRGAQVELEESQTKYVDLYDSAPVGYFSLAENTFIVEVNLTGAALLGVERKHLVKRPFLRYIAKEDHKLFYSYKKQLLETTARQTCELKMLREDRTPFYSQLEGVAVFNGDGGFSHFKVAMLDITERKQAEEALRRTQEELEVRVLERTWELIKANETLQGEITNRKRVEETLRESLAQLSKKNRYETIIRTVTESVHQSINLQDVLENAVEAMGKNMDKVENVVIFLVEGEEAVLRAYRGYPSWYIERVRRIPYPKGATWKTIIEGKPRYVSDTDVDTALSPAGREVGTKSYVSMPVRYEGKAVGCIHIHSTQKDAFDEEELRLLEIVSQQIEVAINNAKQAEALRQSEERYRILFDQSPVGVYIFDKEYKITQCNRRMAQILNSSQDKIIGVNLKGLKDQCVSPLLEKVLSGQPAGYEGLYEATNSSAKLWVSVRLSPLRDAHGNVIGGMAVVEEITERKKAEALLAGEKRVLEMIANSAPLQDVLDILIRTVEEQSRDMLCSFLLLDENGVNLRHGAAPSLPESYTRAVDGVAMGPSVGSCGTAAYCRKPVIVSDIATDPLWADYRDLALSHGLRACWSTPIFSINGSVVGTFAMYYREPRSPGRQELEIIERATHVAGIAIERKRAEEALRENLAQISKKNRYETIVSTVTGSVHQSINLQEVLENAVESMSKDIDVTRHVAIYLVEGETAVMRAYRGHPDWFIERVGKIPYPKGFTWKTIIEGEPIHCPDVDKDTVIGPAGREVGTKSYVSMPIRFGGKTVGCINVHSFQKDAFSEEELNLLNTVARQIEIAISNARQAETLRKSEEKFRNLVEHTNDWIWEIDGNGVFTYVSPRARKIIGYETGEIIGKTTFDFMSPDERGRFAEVISPYISMQKPFTHIEKTLVHRDGRPVVLETSGSPIFDGRGNFQGYRGIAHDITEHKRVEEALRRSKEELEVRVKERTKELATVNEELKKEIAERKQVAEALREGEERYRALYEDNPSMYFTVDAEGKVLSVNRFGTEQLGYTTEELVGQSVLNVFYKDDKEALLEQLNTCLKNLGQIARWELREVRKDGSVLWVRESARAVQDVDGNTVVLIVCEDITEGRLAEEKLRKRTERVIHHQMILLELAKMDNSDLDSALERITEADSIALGAERVSVWLFSEDRREIICKGLYRLSRNLHEVGERLQAEDYPRYFQALEESRILAANDARIDPRTSEFTKEYLKPIGITSMMDVPIRLHGSVVGVLCHEHTGPMREWTVEEQDFAASIADMVSLTLEALERKRAEEQIKASLEEKEVLLKEIHHRVKNNLQVISSLLDLQSRYAGDKQTLRMFKETQSRVRSMALIHRQLYQSKDLAKIDFTEYIRNLVTYLFQSYGVESETISLKISVKDVSLNVDTAVPCGLIINELVSNSLKHAFPKGRKGKIRVSLRSNNSRGDLAGCLYTLIVSDNGVGFPKDLDFRKAESLGLQLVSALTNQLDGAIRLSRRSGTAFKIIFGR